MASLSAEVIPLRPDANNADFTMMSATASPMTARPSETRTAALPLSETSVLTEKTWPRGSRTTPHRFPWAFAAMVMLAVIGIGWLLRSPGERTFSTGIGEQQTYTLADGSIVVLNTGSRLQTHFGKSVRSVELIQGEALFTVAHDAHRPFIVTAGSAVIRAVGTQFNVRERMGLTDVAVVEGSVQVTSATNLPESLSTSPTTPLHAGESARVEHDHVSKRGSAGVSDALAWRDRRLVFHSTSLAEVAEEFNLYNKQRILIEGAAVRDKQVSGIFDVDRPQSIALFAAEDPSLSVRREGENWIISQR
jgi:transmembrane sensor